VLKSAGIELSFSNAAIDYIANAGFDPTYGARPIKRYIQREIENALAAEILTRKLPEKVKVSLKDGKIRFE
jgi:ATP-dependent Clp protease ATP-binding subunit ClpB